MPDIVNVGAQPNDGTGIDYRDAFIAINAAFVTAFAKIAGATSAAGSGVTPAALNAAIAGLAPVLAGKANISDLSGAIADTLTALSGKADRGRTPIGGAPYQAQATDVLIAVTSLSSSQSILLPYAATYPAAQVLLVLDETGLCSPTLPITVTAEASDTIAGQASLALTSPYGTMMLVSNTVNLWAVV